ncbi:LXG domain-containing protein [Lactococcus lactis]|uniref:LXG domain-containing protein n=1 Tax=Lactococcus lactis TaxID=1358 RepID=A0A9X4NFP6_9LACT|nr:hypothetical protein [Lactococcus lactis]MDG4982892.1 LXG domain-containing protein [Lactococcus lactis]
MVIYNSGDSDLLIQTLSDNLKSSKEIFDKINQGTQHLNSVIDSGTLSGAAYRAGQSLFQTYISPMIQKLDSAISDIQNDLNSYKKADQAVRAEGSHLDETQLMQKLENTKKLIQLIEQKIEEDKKVVQKFMSSGFEGVAKGLAELPGLDGQLDNLKSLKRDYEKKLIALQTFSVSTSSLFSDSLQAFKFALQGVDVINQSRASVDGTITFPVGSNMNWLENLKSEKLSSKLKSYDKKLKKYVGQPEVLKSIEQLSEDKGISFSKAESLYNSMQKLKERKYIKPSDKIITTINSFSVSGMNVVYTEVKNETTGKVLSVTGGDMFNEFMKTYNGNNNTDAPTAGLEGYVSIDKDSNVTVIDKEGIAMDNTLGVLSSLFSASGEYEDIKKTFKTETSSNSGRDYLISLVEKNRELESQQKQREKQNYNEQYIQGSPNGMAGTPND